MNRQRKEGWLRRVAKGILVIGLILTLTLGIANEAWAARSGGRMGGGSFRAPSRSYSTPRRSYQSSPNYPVRTGYGGGIGFPFLIPFFGFGGGFGGVFTLLIGLAVLNFIVSAFRNSGLGSGESGGATEKVSVAQVQVGLLSKARSLQTDLDTLAQTVDTGSTSGRARILQETTLALLRNPEYWTHGSVSSKYVHLNQAEAQFNQYSLTERSKFTTETLSNVDSTVQNTTLAPKADAPDLAKSVRQEVGEYLVVTVVVGSQGKLTLPAINSTETLKQAIQTLGSVGSDRLLAVEVLWTPQASGDTLTTDDLLAYYPNLIVV